MILNIEKYGNPILRKKAERVEVIDESIKKLAHDMIETMRKEPGVGIAAPQVGESLRLIVFEVAAMDLGPIVYVNPEIIEKKGSDAGKPQGKKVKRHMENKRAAV